MKECSKSIARRLHDVNFVTRYFVGRGLDIGGKQDPLMMYESLFVKMGPVKTWDWEDGDAQLLASVPNETYDFIHSSHCLEHLQDPVEGLRNWLRVVKQGGYIIFTVLDEDLYEQGQFPSTFNLDHKSTFTINKRKSWSDRSYNIFSLISEMGEEADPVKIQSLNSTYRYDLPRYDQTITPVAECGIEVIIRRRTAAELEAGGSIRIQAETSTELRTHLNQYRDDLHTLKNHNSQQPPFCNDALCKL